MLCHQIMHPAVELQWVLNPSIAIQIPTLLCKINKTQSWVHELSQVFQSYLNTENTRAILPIARILFLMTSLRKLAALPARRRRRGRERELINFQVLKMNCLRSTSKENGERFNNFLLKIFIKFAELFKSSYIEKLSV